MIEDNSNRKPDGKGYVRFWPILLFALLPLIPLWRCVFMGEAIGPFDQVRQMAPWNGPKPAQPWDVLQADGVLQFYPWRDMVFKAWGSGQLPLWNSNELAGTPLLGNSQSAGFYPPHILMGVLHVPTATAMTLLAWFHLFWAGLGVYFLARRFGATREGAGIGGSTFALSVFMLAWTGLPSVISTVSWVPWLLACIASLFEVSTASLRTRWMVGAGFCAGMMILAGHLQFVAYGLMAAVILSAVLAIGSRSIKVFGRVMVGLILGFALAAPQLLPTLSFSQFSHRKNTPDEAGYAAYTAGAIRPFELANLTQAYTLGSPRTPIEIGPETASAYWPALTKRGANLAESAVTIGPLVLGLLFLVPWRERRNWPLAVIGAVALLLALGTVLNYPLYFFVPGWSSTGSPGRIIGLFVLAVCVLASVAVGRDFTAIPKWQKYSALCAPLLIAGLCLVLSQAGGAEGPTVGLASDAMTAATPGALLGGVLASLGIAILVFPGAQKYRPGLVALPLLLAWLGHASNLTMSGTPIAKSEAKNFGRIAVINKDWPIVTTPKALMPPNTAYLLGYSELGGYDSLLHRDTDTLLKDIDDGDPAPPANGNMMFVKPSATVAKLQDAGVTMVATRTEMPQFGSPASSLDGTFTIYDIGGPGRVSAPQGKAEITDQTFSKLVVKASGPGKLIVRDRNMPGWLAKVDGRHESIGGTVWREVDLPAGDHTVEFNYVPPGLMPGLYIGVPAWILMGLLAILNRPRKPA